MAVTTRESTSWFARLRNSLGALVFGVILVLVAIYFLFTNEGRSIQTYRSLVEGAGLVVDVDAAKPDPANDGKLVHISGAVTPASVPADDVFGISADGALALDRNVQMYQWVEKSDSTTENKLGGGTETVTTYSYSKEWSSRPVDLSGFKEAGHDNPQFVVNGANFTVDTARVGAFSAQGSLLSGLGAAKTVMLSEEDVARIADSIATSRPVKANQGGLYIGYSASSPQVGDMKLDYTRTDLSEASLVGKQQGDTLVPYPTSNGRTILLADSGNKPAKDMFDQAQAENVLLTWIIRVAGLFAIFIGFTMSMSIFGVVGDVIPFIGSIVRFGTGIIALILTLIIGPVVIAIGWFAYRPVLALAIIGAGVLIAAGIIYLKRGRAPALASQPAAPQG